MPDADPRLSAIAGRLVWWQSPDRTLADQRRFLAQVMTYGNWDDTAHVAEVLGEDAFIDTLAHAPPGVFDDRSWSYGEMRREIAEGSLGEIGSPSIRGSL